MKKVTALPSTRKIPPSKLPLNTEVGQREYATYARLLFDAGKFDSSAHMQLSLYAAAMDEITRRQTAGEPMRGNLIIQAQKAFRKLNIDEIDRPIAAPEAAKANRFAVYGFACRSQQAVS